ncbi:MAG: UDP-glucose 6-dehydrogenase, partial [Alphaproteobacteria bacterium]|nr:UDP-glucose 6-dehydrogenase [Alphaproteobacteria bacterium]
APSLDILPLLQEAGASLRAFDPAGMNEAKKLLPNITWCTDAQDALGGADAAVVLTEWNEFRGLQPESIAQSLKGKVLVDLRNIYKPADMRAAGLTYVSVGRK